MKILDLFNEYNLSPEMTWWEMEQPRTEKDRNTMSRIYKAYIVSKDFWWIKWLVDNDKIDFSREWEYCTKSIEEFDWLLRDDEDWLIMILAISDTPVDDLISYPK
jgi:hypothetical protein